MEQLITGILGGDLNAASLLMLFIVGILTKRFVPWWIHEEVLEKLKEYEDAAPALLEEVSRLIEVMNKNDNTIRQNDRDDAREVVSRYRQETVRGVTPIDRALLGTEKRKEELHDVTYTPRRVPAKRRTRKK